MWAGADDTVLVDKHSGFFGPYLYLYSMVFTGSATAKLTVALVGQAQFFPDHEPYPGPLQ
jgi:hypothetical protein